MKHINNNMTSPQGLYGANIEYGDGYVMECRAVVGKEELWPFDFLEHFDPRTASKLAQECSQLVTQIVLSWRSEYPDTNTLPLPNTSLLYDFIAGKLGMEPRGKLAYVETLPDSSANGSGLTNYRCLYSVVIKDRIVEDYNADPEFEWLATELNECRVESVAAHELAHLAGAQDRVYFAIDPEAPYPITFIEVASSSVANFPFRRRGKYFEEGLGTLAAAMYMWDKLGEVLHSVTDTQPYRSPNGTLLHLPFRINATGHHQYAFCAWGIENLVDLAPGVWDILLSSRKYGAKSTAIRAELKACIDSASPGLFDHVDRTNVDSLDEVMDSTERIIHAARRFA